MSDARNEEPAPARTPAVPAPPPLAVERGMFGEPPAAVDALGAPAAGAGRRALLWLLGALLAVAVSLWLAVLSVAQATDEQLALPALERGVAALIDIEALLDFQLEPLQAQADRGAETLTPPGFPVRDAGARTSAVTGPGGTVDQVLLHDALLRSSARLVYERGVAAFQQSEEAAPRASRLSPSGGIRALLDALSSDLHGTTVFWLWSLGASSLLLGALLLGLARGLGRFVALGAALTAAAIPVLLAGLAARLALGFVDVAPGDRLAEEFVEIARRLTSLPVRNALWLAGAGVAIALPAAVMNALFDRSVRRPAQDEAPG